MEADEQAIQLQQAQDEADVAIAGLKECPGAHVSPKISRAFATSSLSLEAELPETVPALDHEIRENLGGDGYSGGGEEPRGEDQQDTQLDVETPRKQLNFEDPHLWQDSQPVPPFHVGTTTPEPSPTELESASVATVDDYGALGSPKEKSPQVSWFLIYRGIFGQTGYRFFTVEFGSP